MSEYWTERDGHDDTYTGEETDEVCTDCGTIMLFYETGRIPATREEPGEILGYFECPKCGERFSI